MTAKGDIQVGQGPNAAGTVTVGPDGQVLTADSTQTLGVKWAAGGGGATITQQDAAPSSPAANNLWIDTDDDLWPAGMPGTTLAYAQVTADQNGITTTTDLTGLSVTVTVPAGRRIKITGSGLFQKDATGNPSGLLIYEGGTQLAESLYSLGPSEWGTNTATAIITPTAGTHTYKLSAFASSGATSLRAAATLPAFILVEDVTGSSLPYNPASIPVGVIAQSAWGLTLTGFTAEADIPGSALNVSVPGGRVLKVTAEGRFSANTTGGHIIGRIYMDGVEVARFNNSDVGAGASLQSSNFYVVSPTAGAHTFKLTAQKFNGGNTADITQCMIIIEDITSTPASGTGAPGSTLGYAETLADSVTITSATDVDIPGLTTTITVPAGRRVRVSIKTEVRGSVNDVYVYNIKEGSTVLQRITGKLSTTSSETVTGQVILTPSSGAHTYKLALNLAAGSGVINGAAPTYPAYIVVEDITGSIWPSGSAVTAGMVASEGWTDFTPQIDQGAATNIAKTVWYARYFKLGRLVILQAAVSFTATGAVGQLKFNLPIAPLGAHNNKIVGMFQLYNASGGGGGNIVGSAHTESTGYVSFITDGNTNWVGTASHTFNEAVVNTDALTVSLMYEAAS